MTIADLVRHEHQGDGPRGVTLYIGADGRIDMMHGPSWDEVIAAIRFALPALQKLVDDEGGVGGS